MSEPLTPDDFAAARDKMADAPLPPEPGPREWALLESYLFGAPLAGEMLEAMAAMAGARRDE